MLRLHGAKETGEQAQIPAFKEHINELPDTNVNVVLLELPDKIPNAQLTLHFR